MAEQRPVIWNRFPGGTKPALLVKGKRGGVTMVFNDDCRVTAKKVHPREEKYCTDLDAKLPGFKRSLRAIGKRHTITKGAKKLLRG